MAPPPQLSESTRPRRCGRTGPTGSLRLLPGDQGILPIASSINFSRNQTRTNNAIVPLAFSGTGTLEVLSDSAGSVQFILDVNGYFQ